MSNCKQCSQDFEITDRDRKFYDRISPEFGGKKYSIPEPTLCPECRQQRRLAFCNESNLYPAECNLCKERAMTEHPPHANQPIYCRECWHSDKWDAHDYGCDFDFNRPFFEQLHELKRKTPSPALTQDGTIINSDYVHYTGSCKNCYLIMHATFCEDCYYGYGFKKVKKCVDGFYNLRSEFCYDCIDVHTCHDLVGCQDCINCSSSKFLRDCVGCQDCFLCVGLRNKKYCFENKQFTKEEYQQKIASMDIGSFETYQRCMKKRQVLELEHPFKATNNRNTENSFGDHLINCKDVQYCFDCEDAEKIKYCYQVVIGAKNNYDIYQYGENLQESYECAIVGADAYHLLFTMDGHLGSSDLTYCMYMETSKNCFGCVNMNRASYCIFNKQYTKEEYETLVPRIIEHMRSTGEWGEFFSSDISLFGYNKTTAQMYYPLTKDEVIAKGWKWDDYEPEVKAEKVIAADRLPDNINEIPDDILNWAVECEVTKKPFKIVEQELRFYREKKLPIPRRSPDQRHLDRFYKRNPRKFWDRKCAKCNTDIQTTYSPDRPETVYCDSCYLKKIY